MADDDLKVYTAETISDTPLPNQVDQQSSVSDPSSSQGSIKAYQQASIPDKPTRRKIISEETIGQALNTKSRKILGEFQFTQQGAIKVGNFEEGVSGEVAISPAGIAAKDITGNTTFALDGETGDAFFGGEIRGAEIDIGDGAFTVDRDGNLVANSGRILTYRRMFVTTGIYSVLYHAANGTAPNYSLVGKGGPDTDIRIWINGSAYQFSSPTLTPTSGTVPSGKYAVFMAVVNTSGTFQLLDGANNFTVGYDTINDAITAAGAISIPSGYYQIMFFIRQASGGSWNTTGNTHEVDAGEYPLYGIYWGQNYIYYPEGTSYNITLGYTPLYDASAGLNLYLYFDPDANQQFFQNSLSFPDSVGLEKSLVNILFIRTPKIDNSVTQTQRAVYNIFGIQG